MDEGKTTLNAICLLSLFCGIQALCNSDGTFHLICPPNAELLTIGSDLQTKIVATHNEVRQKWASGIGLQNVTACRMATIRWNRHLAELAELNVKECQKQYDTCESAKFKYKGQNIYLAEYTDNTTKTAAEVVEDALEKWTNADKKPSEHDIRAYPNYFSGNELGHFTIMVHERNVAMGCAALNYGRGLYNTYLLTCNYATNNIIGWPVFRICDKIAVLCESGTNPNYPALCSIKEKVDYNYALDKKT